MSVCALKHNVHWHGGKTRSTCTKVGAVAASIRKHSQAFASTLSSPSPLLVLPRTPLGREPCIARRSVVGNVNVSCCALPSPLSGASASGRMKPRSCCWPSGSAWSPTLSPRRLRVRPRAYLSTSGSAVIKKASENPGRGSTSTSIVLRSEAPISSSKGLAPTGMGSSPSTRKPMLTGTTTARRVSSGRGDEQAADS